MQICELHQKYPGQHFPDCKCDTDHEGAVFCDFHKKFPNLWLASCDCGVEEKKLRLKGHKLQAPESAPQKVTCEGLTGAGNPCKFLAAAGSKFCKLHTPKDE